MSAVTDETDSLPLTICWFETAMPTGRPELGDPEHTTWGAFASIFEWRRVGEKDGACFAPSVFKLEPDGRQVRRLKANVLARTAIALDIEQNAKTGEIPPLPDEVMQRINALELACLIYTSHNHQPSNVRYRILLPLSEPSPHELPAPEVMAETLGLAGVLDRSKITASSLFYIPSSPYGALEHHQTLLAPGRAISGWITEAAGALLRVRLADAECKSAEANAEAAVRRKAKLAAGFDPDDSIIEKLRSRLDLNATLTAHGYDKSGTKYRHPNSKSGSYGADIKMFGGIKRVYSHNGSDPLHADNLPNWCDGVTAIDAFDVVAILEYGGDRTRALRELSLRFNLAQSAERKALTRLLFRMIKSNAAQEEIERVAFSEGKYLGLSRDEVCDVARWVANHCTLTRKAA